MEYQRCCRLEHGARQHGITLRLDQCKLVQGLRTLSVNQCRKTSIESEARDEKCFCLRTTDSEGIQGIPRTCTP